MTRLEVDPGRPGDAACTDIARARARIIRVETVSSGRRRVDDKNARLP